MPLDANPLLLLGASGQIGSCLCARLADKPVIGVARRPPPATARAQWITADLEGPLLSLATRRIDHVIATVPIWLLARQIAVLERVGVRRLVCFSSTSILGKASSASQFEQTQRTMLLHGEAAVSAAAEQAGIALTILRPTLTYGIGQDQTIASAARFMQRYGFYPIAGPASGLRQPVHADDLAAAALAALESPVAAGRNYALGGGETLTYRAMIERIFRVLELPPRLLPVPLLGLAIAIFGRLTGNPAMTAAMVARMNFDLAFDDGSATRDFGYAPRKFLSGGRADLGLST